ncbi:hypothetical protein TWF481_004484 [Arthrobotrys musiformis]|uniref:Peptidase S8/S53 domain-containing protein n=1 Tax=Arthrobotrys musiformis TaxID=47236 RepID=A0AAV9WLP7_9PEZI
MKICSKIWGLVSLLSMQLVTPTLQDTTGDLRGPLPKIGTHEQASRICYVILVKKYRDERESPSDSLDGSINLRNLREELLTAALPPKHYSVYDVASRYLGTWAIIVDRAPGREAYHKLKGIVQKYKKIIRAAQCDHGPQIHIFGPFISDDYDESTFFHPETPPPTLRRRSDIQNFASKSRRNLTAEKLLEPRASSDEIYPGVLAQSWARPELVMISQPEGVSLEEMEGTYYSYPNAGDGVLTYVIDSGCDFTLPEFAHIDVPSVDWLFSGPLPSDERSDDDEPSNPQAYGHYLAGSDLTLGHHGTLVAGQIVGNTMGVASSASLVVVKLQTGRNVAHTLIEIESLLKVYDHMYEERQKRGDSWLGFVVVYPHSDDRLRLYPESFANALINLYVELVKAISGHNGHIIVPAGNEDPDVPIPGSGFPTAMKARAGVRSDPHFIVVGGIDTGTGLNAFQTADYVNFYGPGTNLRTVLPTEETVQGTSLVVPMVAGLLATLLGQGVENPVEQMEKWAYPRAAGGPDVIWNGITKAM